jgi:hypothetical protein
MQTEMLRCSGRQEKGRVWYAAQKPLSFVRRQRQQQLVGFHAKSPRQPLKIVERDVPRLSLNVGNKRSVQARLESKHLLRPALRVPKRHDVRCEQRTCTFSTTKNTAGIHTCECESVQLLSQPLLDHNFGLLRTCCVPQPTIEPCQTALVTA